MSERKADRAIE
jgi:chromosome segregation ATPase